MSFNLNRLILIIFIFEFITISIADSKVDEDELEILRIQAENKANWEGIEKWRRYLENNVNIGIKQKKYSYVNRNILLLVQVSMDINVIVRRFYNGTISNFELLNNYARNSGHAEISFEVLEELWRQLKVVADHQSPLKEFCELHKTLTEKIIDSRNLTYDQIEYANIMWKDISENIEKCAVYQLSNALATKTFDKVQEWADLVFKTNETIFDQSICKAINDSYNGVRFRELIQTMWTHKFAGQKAAALSCITECLLRNMDNNPDATMLLAYYFYKLKKSYDYRRLKEYKSKEVDNRIEDLPQIVRNLYFNENLCFQNIKSKDYIAPDFVYDDYKHEVFLSKGGHIREEAIWHVYPVGEFLFEFRNRIYGNECLYADHHQRGFWTPERLVFTWQAQDYSIGDAKEHVTWRVTLHKPEPEYQISITNEAYDELLCVSEETTKQEGSREYANAVTIDGDSDDQECRWTIQICPTYYLFGSPPK